MLAALPVPAENAATVPVATHSATMPRTTSERRIGRGRVMAGSRPGLERSSSAMSSVRPSPRSRGAAAQRRGDAQAAALAGREAQRGGSRAQARGGAVEEGGVRRADPQAHDVVEVAGDRPRGERHRERDARLVADRERRAGGRGAGGEPAGLQDRALRADAELTRGGRGQRERRIKGAGRPRDPRGDEEDRAGDGPEQQPGDLRDGGGGHGARWDVATGGAGAGTPAPPVLQRPLSGGTSCSVPPT